MNALSIDAKTISERMDWIPVVSTAASLFHIFSRSFFKLDSSTPYGCYLKNKSIVFHFHVALPFLNILFLLFYGRFNDSDNHELNTFSKKTDQVLLLEDKPTETNKALTPVNPLALLEKTAGGFEISHFFESELFLTRLASQCFRHKQLAKVVDFCLPILQLIRDRDDELIVYEALSNYKFGFKPDDNKRDFHPGLRDEERRWLISFAYGICEKLVPDSIEERNKFMWERLLCFKFLIKF